MAALLRLPGGTRDASEIVEGLLVAASVRETTAPELAARWRQIAHDIGDSLDALPPPRQEHTQPTHLGSDPSHGGLTTHRGRREDCSGPDCGTQPVDNF